MMGPHHGTSEIDSLIAKAQAKLPGVLDSPRINVDDPNRPEILNWTEWVEWVQWVEWVSR